MVEGGQLAGMAWKWGDEKSVVDLHRRPFIGFKLYTGSLTSFGQFPTERLAAGTLYGHPSRIRVFGSSWFKSMCLPVSARFAYISKSSLRYFN